MTAVKRLEKFDHQLIESVCEAVAQTEAPGLAVWELEKILPTINLRLLPAPRENYPKRARLRDTLVQAQRAQGCGNSFVAFLNAAFSPARFTHEPKRFDQLRDLVNPALALYGYKINEAGKLAKGEVAATLTDASKLSGELFSELKRRNCHPLLLKYAEEELVSKSLFHAISEASKSIPDRLRRHTGLPSDGDALYTAVFGSKNETPLVFITAMQNDSEVSEQRGFKNLLTGIHGHYRNPRAHSSRMASQEDKEDFYDAFSLYSYVHRRLDRAGVKE